LKNIYRDKKNDFTQALFTSLRVVHSSLLSTGVRSLNVQGSRFSSAIERNLQFGDNDLIGLDYTALKERKKTQQRQHATLSVFGNVCNEYPSTSFTCSSRTPVRMTAYVGEWQRKEEMRGRSSLSHLLIVHHPSSIT
jgi:hypothetical protein